MDTDKHGFNTELKDCGKAAKANILFGIRNTILQLRARTTKIWTAVAERSGDTAFRTAGCFQKRRGASLPAAVQKIVVAAKGRAGFIRVHPWSIFHSFSEAQIRV
jgi:hypothetical protein